MGMFSPSEASLVDRLPYWGFMAPDIVLTTDGLLLLFAQVTPAGVDGKSAEDLDQVTQAWQRLLAAVEAPHRAFFVFQRPEPPLAGDFAGRDDLAGLAQRKRAAFVSRNTRQMDVYLVVAFDPKLRNSFREDHARWWMAYARRWLRERTRQEHLTFYVRELMADAVAAARTRYQALVAQVSDLTPVRTLEGNAITRLLHRIVNQAQGAYAPLSRNPRYGLSWRLADETLVFERNHMLVGDKIVGLYSLALPPQASAANALGELYSLPVDLCGVLEWRPVERYEAARRIRSVQKHYNTMRWSFLAAITDTEGTQMAVEDASSGAAVEQLHRAMLELETVGVPYGDFALSFSLAVDSPAELDEVGAQIQRVVTELDGKAVKERYGQPSVWFQRWPGQKATPFARPLFVSAGQVATMAPLFGPVSGYERCKHLDAPPLTRFETRWSSLYGYDLFGGKDVGHTLVLGATGSGKSFLLNFLLTQALQYDPRVVILDLGGSYRWITEFVEGSYLGMSAEVDPAAAGLQPLGLEPGERTTQFLTGWLRRLLELGDYPVQSAELEDIRRRIEDVYRLPREERTLSAVVKLLDKEMWPALGRWVGEGAWASTFDGPPRPVELARDRWQVIDLAGAQEHEDWCAAALSYLFERLRLVIDDEKEIGRLKLMVVDEAWRYLSDPSVLTALMEAAKTWRKRNAVLVLATQSVVDVASNDAARALLEMLPTKLFLANPDFPRSAADTLSLTDAQFETVRTLQPKQEIYLHRAREQVVLRLGVDPESYWLYTSSPTDAAVRARMVAAYGLEGALTRLAAGLREPGEDVMKQAVLA